MDDAIKVGEAAIAALVPQASEEATLLREGMVEGLGLGVDTIKLVRGRLRQLGDEIDLKLLRVGNEAAALMVRVGTKIAEAEFRARREDRIGEILERLANAGREPVDG